MDINNWGLVLHPLEFSEKLWPSASAEIILFFKLCKIINWSVICCSSYCNSGETVTIVGDHDPSLMKYFDCTRSGPRSAFDGNVVYQFENMEYVS